MPRSPYEGTFPSNWTAPFQGLAVVTPSDAADLPVVPTRGIRVATAGNVSVVTEQGDTVTIESMQAGQWEPISVRRIRTTGTTVTGQILAGY